MNSYSLLALVSLILITGCSNVNQDPDFLKEKITITGENRILGMESKIKGDAHSGEYFSRIDSNTNFSLGYLNYFNDELVNQNVEIKLSAWVRVDILETTGALAVSIYEGETCLLWKEFELKSVISETNKWQHVFVTYQVSKKILSKKGLHYSVFGFKPKGIGHMDIDDLEISLSLDKNVYPE